MINITIDPEQFELKISGHANYDEKGKDIVCAAVSILFYTLADALQSTPHIIEKLDKAIGDEESSIKCVPKAEYISNVALMYWMTLNGMQLIADDYSDYVSLNVVG